MFRKKIDMRTFVSGFYIFHLDSVAKVYTIDCVARQIDIEGKKVQQYTFYKMAETEPAWKLILGGKTIVDIAGKVIELPVVITTGAFEDIMIDKCPWT